jgi:hypothetical protein
VSVFAEELQLQRDAAMRLLHDAEQAGDESLASALLARLDELSEIAARNGLHA